MVSVIIPVFNKKDTIAQCLDSVLANDYQDKEIIAVDDHSTDGTLEILRGYARKGVVLIELAAHQGISFACNAALARARGDIVIRTDADTIVPPNWIDLFVRRFADKNVVAIGGSYRCLNRDSATALCTSTVDLIFAVLLRRKLLLNKLPGANRALRKEALLSIGGFSGLSEFSEDVGIFLKLKKLGRVIFDPAIIVSTQYPDNLKQLCRRHYNNGYGIAVYLGHPKAWIRPVFIFGFYLALLGLLPGYFILFYSLGLAAVSIGGLFLLPGKKFLFWLVPVIFIVQNTAYTCGMITAAGNTCLKRAFDVGFSLFGIIASLPLWAVISLAIYMEDGGPVFFSDIRAGRNKRAYRHFKFRTMFRDAERETGPVWSGPQDRRVTKTGRILRATALDELPQLINILKGDMSFVGPRPERTVFVDRFIKEIPGYERRFSVRPGLTGTAQVYGKYDTPPAVKLRYEIEYINNMNIFLDLKLIFLSFVITLRGGWSRFEGEHK
jgi:lipopolysaccharide/colanic/teichoic acid biosynthesis glycosyltransferase